VKRRQWLYDYLFILIGAVITALALDFFLVPNRIAAGGVSGLATVVYYLSKFKVGLTMLIIPLLASVFGGKDSTGIMLPMLIVGDVCALSYYHKSATWKDIVRPLPSTLAGLAIGAFVGNSVSDGTFLKLIGIIILLCLSVLIYMEKKGQNLKVPNSAWFYITIGVLSGFFSMMGNAAGPIFSIYLLALGYAKNNYMGSTTWFFFIVNILKLPLQIFVWHNITVKNLIVGISMIPLIIAGAVLGAFILKKINEKVFRYIVIVMTAFAAIRLLI
jgi:uncharacterized membrane protein YfcA